MNLSVNGQSLVPPGFRFHPTEEELLLYYLPKKLANEEINLNVIQDVDLNKLEPWDIQDDFFVDCRDKVIKSSCSRIGMRKTLVFYTGRAQRGQKSDWIMHEYRLDENIPPAETRWVVCRVFKKASLISDQVTIDSNILDQKLVYKDIPPVSFLQNLPGLESPIADSTSGPLSLSEHRDCNNQELCCSPLIATTRCNCLT